MAVHPIASLKPVSIIVPIADREFMVAAKPAQDWLEVLLEDEPRLIDIVPGWCEPACGPWLYRNMIRGQFTVKQWGDMIWEVIGVASGRPWWQAMNLIVGMKDPQNWHHIFGHLTLRGLDPTRISLAAWLDATYALCTENMSADDRTKFNLTLDTPPPTVDPAEAIDEVEQERSFWALMAEVSNG